MRTGTDSRLRCGTIGDTREISNAVHHHIDPNIKVRQVRPHPIVSRLAGCWDHANTWRPKRKLIRTMLTRTSRRTGIRSLQRRRERWNEASRAAATGLDSLEWRRLRRIVGVGPWGEQLLIRLKLHAFSVYDPTTGHNGCPHDACISEGTVDLVHVFWTCPGAAHLRHVFLGP
eukprot:jgi/Phyca11/103650/e_gw1.8.793.1